MANDVYERPAVPEAPVQSDNPSDNRVEQPTGQDALQQAVVAARLLTGGKSEGWTPGSQATKEECGLNQIKEPDKKDPANPYKGQINFAKLDLKGSPFSLSVADTLGVSLTPAVKVPGGHDGGLGKVGPVDFGTKVGGAKPDVKVSGAKGVGEGGKDAGKEGGKDAGKDGGKDAGDSKERPPSATIEQAREHLRSSLEAKGMSDTQIKEVMANMEKMEDHLRKNPPKTTDGTLDPTKESIRAYDALSKITNGGAERQSHGIKFSSDSNVDTQRVLDIVRDGAARLGDQEHGHNQGNNNTCALQSDGRQESFVSPATYAERLASITNTGAFKDMRGKETRVDMASLCNFDAQAANYTPGQGRGPAGKIMDLGSGQWVQNHLSGTFGADQSLTYKQGAPSGRGDTGERVIEKSTGKVVADNPQVDANTLGAMKQQLYGDRFDPNFGKLNTITNGAAFKGANMTSFTDAKAYSEHLQSLEGKGWNFPTLVVHTSNWRTDGSNGGDGGWHAISGGIQKDATGKPKIGADGLAMTQTFNNWNGKYQGHSTATQALKDGTISGPGAKHAWQPDGHGGSDHKFDGGKYSDLHPTEVASSEKKSDDRVQENKQEKKGDEKDGKDLLKHAEALQAQIKKAQKVASMHAQIASLKAHMAQLNEKDSLRNDLSGEINNLQRQGSLTDDV